jgi:transposase InsO family protein
MPRIHPNARTTPVTRAEIARSHGPSGALARRYGVSTETIRKRRKRGPRDCPDRSAQARPAGLPRPLRPAAQAALEGDRRGACHRLRPAPRDQLRARRPDLRRRPLPAAPQPRQRLAHPPGREGLSRRPPPSSDRPKRGQGRFRDYDLGFAHIGVKHLPKLQTADGERRKRYLYVAIDRRSRSVHLAVKDDETTKSATASLREAAAAFPFRLTRVLTDNGSCFTPAFAKACAELGAEYRHTRPYSPQTNGMAERFNGRVGSEVLGITIWSHQDLEQVLRGFNAAYNARRQRVLGGKTPDQVVAERLKARRKLANAKPHGRAGPDDIAKARFIAEAAEEVSRPDS